MTFVGYYVADTSMTINNIYDAMAEVLCEASFFGYEQEELEESKRRFEQAYKEAEDYFKEMYGDNPDFNESSFDHELYEQQEEKRAVTKEEDFKREVFIAINSYNNYSREKQLSELINLHRAQI